MSRARALERRVDRRLLATVVALGAALALAAALRFFNLTGQSLWNDEGTSVALAGRSLGQITLSAAADIHPPLYYYLLHYWLRLFGPGDAAARSLSALLGVGLVGLTYLLGQRLFGRLAGVAGAFVAAAYPYQVYYAQEARMYMLLATLGAASVGLFYEGWLTGGEERRRHLWIALAWAVVTAAAMYTHYLAAAVLLAQNLAWLSNPWRAWRAGRPGGRALRRLALTWAAAQGLVGLLYLPWLRLTWAQLHSWPAVSEPFGLLTLLRRALSLFALGPTAPQGASSWLAAGVLGVALLGLAWPGRRDLPERLLAVAYWLAPVAVLYYLSRSRPVYHPKFLVAATPGFTLLVGRGVARLAGDGATRRPWRLALAAAAGLFVLLAGLPGLRNYYFDPRYARDDYRGIARYIAAVGGPGDILLVNAPSQIETAARYYQGPLPMVPIPRQRPPDREETVRELEELTRDARRVYAILWATDESDPERIVEGWLDAHAYKALDAWYGNLRLVAYAMPDRGAIGSEQRVEANLGECVRLEGYALASAEVAAGDIVQLALSWRATGPIAQRYKVFTHLLDSAGHLIGQRDAEPGGGTRLTTGWEVGEEIVDRYGLPIPHGTPPGEYLIEVGMYGLEDGRRLPVLAEGQPVADRVLLQPVRVLRPAVPPPLAALDLQERRSIADGLQLVGLSIGRAGALDQGRVPLRPGEVAEVVLYWQATETPVDDPLVWLRVVDGQGRLWLERQLPPTEGRYPACAWQPQEVVRDPVHLPLPAELPSGRYRLLVGWQEGAAAGPPALHELAAFMVE